MIATWKLYAGAGAALFLAGFGSGCWLTNALHKAAESDEKDKIIEDQTKAIEETAKGGRDAARTTRDIGAILERAVDEMGDFFDRIELEPQTEADTAEKDTRDALATIPETTDNCLARVPDRSVCLANADILGLDPDLSCPEG